MKKLVVVDIECLPNYILIAFKGLESGKLILIDAFGASTSLTREQKTKLNSIMSKYTTFGFNSERYDLPMINYALTGATCYELYKASKDIIGKNQPAWMTYRNLALTQRSYDHFDVKEPSPAVMISLKNYGTRIGSPKLQDFYLDPDLQIDEVDVGPLKSYCENDLDVTIDLYNAIVDRIGLRISMGEQYGMDLRSKSDAQIAETVIVSELKKHGVTAVKPELTSSYRARYVAPHFIQFDTPLLRQLIPLIQTLRFELGADGKPKMPKELSAHKIKIGSTEYKIGMGGLHSKEKKLSVTSNETHVMRNADFDAFYPYMILEGGLCPKHLGVKFLDVYRNIVERRIAAKKSGDTLVNKSLKIVINGSFGKFGSKYSKLYGPDMMLATTITGQLTLLMLIEQLERHGIAVVSANTDGVEYFCPREKVALAETIIFDLELISGYTMEHGEYLALHAANVNNYVAVYDGYVKSKGIYALPWIVEKNDPNDALKKGTQTPIVYIAIREYLLNGDDIEQTIRACADINFFVSARTVKGGGVYDGEYLGKMVRWYYSTESRGCISYKLNGNKVPKTDGCRPMMDLTDGIPDDLDYHWYIAEAISKLKDLGVDYES